MVGEEEQTWLCFLIIPAEASPELTLLNHIISPGSDEGFCFVFFLSVFP